MKLLRAVLDTNVIITALRNSSGASYKLLLDLNQGKYVASVSTPLVLEYESVLLRNQGEIGLSKKEISSFVDFICHLSNRCKIFFLWRPILRDPSDEMVLEVAVASKSNFIVTFNKKDFIEAEKFGIVVVTPSEFLKIIEVK